MVKVTQRVRYPPFEADRLIPAALPIAESTYEVEGDIAPPFKVGNEDGWLIERVVEGDEYDLDFHGEEPAIIKQQRKGWYLLPHPIHSQARKFINGSVIVLLLCLFYLFTAPLQDSIGIPVFGTGEVRLGMLDYPALALIVVPFMLTPIVLRIGANLGDLKRQNTFLNSAPIQPTFTLNDVISGEVLKGKITLPETREDWVDLTITWRCGILSPARHKVFAALGKDVNSQPPPGLTTPLPHHWEKGLDDGTGMGEDAPMQRDDIPGGVFLRPMRIMSSGSSEKMTLEGGEFTLESPEGDWPGSLYCGLIRVHWELILLIRRKKGGPLLWVSPLEVKHPDSEVVNPNLIISDGRSESDSL